MNRKYIKRTGNIYKDYELYLGDNNIYSVIWGDKPKGYRKASYIWKRLLYVYFPKGTIRGD
jgi:hypothetical protein